MVEKRNPIIVHLPHPGAEHTIGRKLDKNSTFPWNNGDHRRKFISAQGKYIEKIKDKSGIDGTLYFWGEWEQPSIVTKIASDTDRMSGIDSPTYFHEPRLGELDKNCRDMYKRYNSMPNPKKGYQNTDPYVFGDHFYYSCCRQDDNKGKQLKELKSGDLIIFYGGDKKEGKKKIRLDTVFVVAEKCFEYGRDKDGLYIIIEEDSKKKRYHYDDIRNKSQVSEKYLNGVLNAIMFGHNAKEEEHVSFVLYSGATKANPVNGMFSYFICKTEKDRGNKGFPRMAYDVETLGDNAFGFSYSLQSPKYRVNNKTILNYANCEDIYEYWEKLTKDIVSKGYKLGISAKEPS